MKLQVVLVPPSALKERTKPRNAGPVGRAQAAWGHGVPSSPYVRDISTSTPNPNSSLMNPQATNSQIISSPEPSSLRKFLHITQKHKTLLTIAGEISDRFSKLYPEEEPLSILKLQDSQECDLDPDYTAGDVFDYDNIVRVLLSREIKSYEDSILDLESEVNSHGKRPASQNSSILNIPKKRASSRREPIWGEANDSRRSTPLSNQIFPDDSMLDADKTTNKSHRNISINGQDSDLSLPPPEDDNTRYLDPKKQKPTPGSPLPSSKRITSGMLVAPEPQLKDAAERTLQEQEIQEKITQKIIPSKKSPEEQAKSSPSLKDILAKRDTSVNRKNFFSDDSDDEEENGKDGKSSISLLPALDKNTPSKASATKNGEELTPDSVKKTTAITQGKSETSSPVKKPTAAQTKAQEAKASQETKALQEKEEAKKASELKKEAEAKKKEEEKKNAEFKKEAAKKAEELKRAEELKKAEELKEAEEEKQRMAKEEEKAAELKRLEAKKAEALKSIAPVSETPVKTISPKASQESTVAPVGYKEPWFSKGDLNRMIITGKVTPALKDKLANHSKVKKPLPQRFTRKFVVDLGTHLFQLQFTGESVPAPVESATPSRKCSPGPESDDDDDEAMVDADQALSPQTEEAIVKPDPSPAKAGAITTTTTTTSAEDLTPSHTTTTTEDTKQAAGGPSTPASSQRGKYHYSKDSKYYDPNLILPDILSFEDVPLLEKHNKAIMEASDDDAVMAAKKSRTRYIYNSKRRVERRLDSAAKAADTPSKNATKSQRAATQEKAKKQEQANPTADEMLSKLIVPSTEVTKDVSTADLFQKARDELVAKKERLAKDAESVKLAQKSVAENGTPSAKKVAKLVEKKPQQVTDSSDESDSENYDSALDTIDGANKKDAEKKAGEKTVKAENILTTTSSSSSDENSSSDSSSGSSSRSSSDSASESSSDSGSGSDSDDDDDDEDDDDSSSDEESSVKKPRIVNTPKSFSQPPSSKLDLRKATLSKTLDEKLPSSQPSPSTATNDLKSSKKSNRLSLSSLSDLASRGVPDVQDSLTPKSERKVNLSRQPLSNDGSDSSDSSDDDDSSSGSDSDGSDDSDDEQPSGSQKFINAKAAKDLLGKGATKAKSKRVSSAFKDLMKDAAKTSKK
ncbi:CYFA0S16e01948g1_1 [Cyberlindnera fabianii]|uniref:CYFA0S16e01948g1_1 n=1 Tax=Cyberlindnera fabianii TaxID=36022 RepID=A0A061B6T3_CYBFA|nr:CYFA0S16e01948g1_1 [Cyberlindnera fabianii]